MRTIVAAAVAVLFAFAPAAMAEEKPASKPGEPVNGLKLTISADRTDLALTPIEYDRSTPDSPPYRVETPAKLTFTFTNVSDKPVKLDAYDLVFSRFAFEVTGPDAQSVKAFSFDKARELAAPTEKDYPVIAPGASWSCPYTCDFPGLLGPRIYHLLKPGEYRVKVTYRRDEGRDAALPVFANGVWTGTLTGNELVFKVMDDEALKKEKEKEAAKVKSAGPAPVRAREEAPPVDVAGLKPGEAVNGLKFAVAANKADLKMEPIEYAAAQPNAPPFKVERAELTFSVTNASDKPVKFNTYDLVLSGVELAVTGPDDKSVRVLAQHILRNHMALPSERDIITLEPGQTWTCKDASFFPDDFGARVYQLLKPGEFRVRAIMTRTEMKGYPFTAGSWTGRVMSNELLFKAAVK